MRIQANSRHGNPGALKACWRSLLSVIGGIWGFGCLDAMLASNAKNP
jgi:hypothetical protein